MDKLKEYINQLKKEVDSYQDTVWALLAFRHEMLWCDDIRETGNKQFSCFGRRMTTSEDNKVSPMSTVTPDLVVMPKSEMGVVAEVKIGFRPSADPDPDDYNQLVKYDDNLTGWFTEDETIDNHDIVFLVHNTRKVETCDSLSDLINRGNLLFSRKLVVVGFALQQQFNDYIYLEKGFGDLTNQAKNEKLRKGLSIGTEHLTVEGGDISFYDDEPPLPLLMEVVWSTLPPLLEIEEYRKEEGNHEVSVTADLLVDEISKQMFPCWSKNDSRRPRIPRKKWINKALRAFKEMKWATCSNDSEYCFELKKRRKPPFDHFLEYEAKCRMKRDEKVRQDALEKELSPSLFDEVNGWD